MSAWDVVGLACFFVPGVVVEILRIVRTRKENHAPRQS